MTSSPAVSVVMPAYNAEKYIGQAIDSVRAQSFNDWELIVVDDKSADSTLNVARSKQVADSRIKIIALNANGGCAHARNEGIRQARGAYVALLDSDDYWEPCKLDLQHKLAHSTKASIIYCSYDLVNSEGGDLGRPFVVPQSTNFDEMLVSCVISCSTAFIERDLLLAHPFSETATHEDYLLWMTLLREGCAACGVPDVLMHYRQVEGSRSHGKLRAAKGRWEIYRKGLGLSWGTSVQAFARYSFAGVRKYYL